jgi:soluble lytic murein transglycosylase-like protein
MGSCRKTIVQLWIVAFVAVVSTIYTRAEAIAFDPPKGRSINRSIPPSTFSRPTSRRTKHSITVARRKAAAKIASARRARASTSHVAQRPVLRSPTAHHKQISRSTAGVRVASSDPAPTNICALPSSERTRRLARSIGTALSEEAYNASLVSEAADRHGVPKPLALAVAFHESRLDTCATSHTGVKGVMQVTGMTARTYRLDRNLNQDNVEAGVRVLRAAIRRCGARDYGCLAANYNGSTKVERAKWSRGVRAAHLELRYQVGERLPSSEAGVPEQSTRFVRLATAGSLL